MNNFKKDYYGILQVSSSATFDEIKLAYRKQAKKYHPDLHPDNPDYEALIKEINEAYGVLSNKDERFAYDQYRLNKQREAKASARATEKKKRTYTKTTTIYKEERTYVKGKIFIKYFGEHTEQEAENILRETFYKITVTQTEAVIENIFKQNLTPEFQEIFSKNKPIQLKIKQPINCIVKHKNGDDINYKLEILDLTIPNPEIINVTKHEDQSFGTITGVFYGYIKEIKSHEESVIVEECYGETGKAEEKTENGIKYYRKEYYNTDCTKYWGNWIKENIRYTSPRSTSSNQYRARHWRTRSNYASSNAGCLGSFGGTLGFILSLLFFLFLMPKLAFLFSFVIIPLLFKIIPSNTWRWVARAIFILFGLIFTLAIIASIRSNYQKKNERTVVNPKPNPIKPKYTPVTDSSSNKLIKDTLISHELSWEDYDGKTYEGRFSIKKSISEQAHFYKENLNISADNEANYDKIVYLLKENDKNNLSGLYSMFDSLRLANRPSQMKFAEIIVSSIQSIPYTLILPKACDPQLYQDEFTAKYLASPMARCDGYEKYGINTPVEFITYLNGDCDTRTLLLYTVLSHYGYDVALLSSVHYSHSVLGINLPYDGTTFDYNNQRYVLWETTVQNMKPGILSNEISNIDYWRISLKSK